MVGVGEVGMEVVDMEVEGAGMEVVGARLAGVGIGVEAHMEEEEEVLEVVGMVEQAGVYTVMPVGAGWAGKEVWVDVMRDMRRI